MKTVNMIISAVVFTALALGLAGAGKPVIVVALVLQAVQFVWIYGREWGVKNDDTDIPTGFIYQKQNPSVKDDNNGQQMDQIKTIDEP